MASSHGKSISGILKLQPPQPGRSDGCPPVARRMREPIVCRRLPASEPEPPYLPRAERHRDRRARGPRPGGRRAARAAAAAQRRRGRHAVRPRQADGVHRRRAAEDRHAGRRRHQRPGLPRRRRPAVGLGHLQPDLVPARRRRLLRQQLRRPAVRRPAGRRAVRPGLRVAHQQPGPDQHPPAGRDRLPRRHLHRPVPGRHSRVRRSRQPGRGRARRLLPVRPAGHGRLHHPGHRDGLHRPQHLRQQGHRAACSVTPRTRSAWTASCGCRPR